MSEVVGPWLGSRLFMAKWLPAWFCIYPIYKHCLPIIGYFYEGDHAAQNGVWNYSIPNALQCAEVTKQGWILFGK